MGTYLLCVSWLWILVNDFKCGESEGLYEKMLINEVSTGCCNNGGGFSCECCVDGRVLLRGGLEEATQSFKEPHDLGFTKNVRKDFKVCTELREAFEAEQARLLVRVEGEVGHDGSVHAAQNLDDDVVLEDFHELQYLGLGVVALLRALDTFVEGCQVSSDQSLQRLCFASLSSFSILVVTRVRHIR